MIFESNVQEGATATPSYHSTDDRRIGTPLGKFLANLPFHFPQADTQERLLLLHMPLSSRGPNTTSLLDIDLTVARSSHKPANATLPYCHLFTYHVAALQAKSHAVAAANFWNGSCKAQAYDVDIIDQIVLGRFLMRGPQRSRR